MKKASQNKVTSSLRAPGFNLGSVLILLVDEFTQVGTPGEGYFETLSTLGIVGRFDVLLIIVLRIIFIIITTATTIPISIHRIVVDESRSTMIGYQVLHGFLIFLENSCAYISLQGQTGALPSMMMTFDSPYEMYSQGIKSCM